MLNHTSTKYLLTIALLIILLYGTFVFRHIFHKPEIIIDQEQFIETDAPTLTISGSVKNLSSLSINTKPLLFEQTGYFEQQRTLQDGISTITLEGVDRFGRETETTITVNKKSKAFVAPTLEERLSEREGKDREQEEVLMMEASTLGGENAVGLPEEIIPEATSLLLNERSHQ